MKSGVILGLSVVSVLALGGCAPSDSKLNALSAAGVTQPDAPVKAEVAVQITAPPARVWGLLVKAQEWPRWCPQIESVNTSGPLAVGTRFTWKSGGTRIHSEVHLFEPQHRLSWTGTAFPAHAVHVWDLEPTPGGGTLVTVSESMDGPLMGKLFPSDKLAASERSWLDALKAAAEK